MTTGTAAAIYLRISDDREGRELGVGRQREDLRKLADDLGVTATEYVDNDTGASTRSQKRRPGYDRLIEDARQGRVKLVLAYTSSRLTRRPRENEDLIELYESYGVRYRYLRSPEYDLSTADGRMGARIAASFDAAESERISERVKRKRADQRRNGEYAGGTVPWWTRPVNGRLELIPERQSVVVEAVDRVCRGESQAAVCRWLNSTPYRPSRAPEWSSRVTRSILRNPALLGYSINPDLVPRDDKDRRRFDLLADPLGAVVRGESGEPMIAVDPIIGYETWKTLQARLAADSHPRANNDLTVNLLTGIVTCGLCSGPRDYRSGVTKGRLYRRNGCRNRARKAGDPRRCDGPHVAAEHLDKLAQKVFLDHYGDDEITRQDQPAPSTGELDRLRGTLDYLLGQVVAQPAAVASQFQAQIDSVSARIAELEQPAEMTRTGYIYRERWAEATVAERRQMLLDGRVRVVVVPVTSDAPEAAVAALRAIPEPRVIGWYNPGEPRGWGAAVVADIPPEVRNATT